MKIDRSGIVGYHCSTEQSAKEFIKECYNKGIRWQYANSNGLTDKDTCWEIYKENTCYVVEINVVGYTYVDYLKKYDMKIVEYVEQKVVTE